MSAGEQHYRAFREEFIKIALTKKASVLRHVGRVGKDLLSAGWHGVGPEGSPTRMGRFGKAMTMLGPALGLPAALAKDDPTGQGRSRTERMTGLAGNTAASLALGGAVNKMTAGFKSPWVSIPAGIGASLLAGPTVSRAGEAAATAPWQLARKLRPQQDRGRVPARPDERWREQSPAQSPSVPLGVNT